MTKRILTHENLKPDTVLSTTEIAELFHYSKRTVWGWIVDGLSVPGRGVVKLKDLATVGCHRRVYYRDLLEFRKSVGPDREEPPEPYRPDRSAARRAKEQAAKALR